MNIRRSTLLAAIIACTQSGLLPALSESQPTWNSWKQVQASGSGNMDANRYWLAEPELKQALAEAESFGVPDIRLATSLGELGRLYTIRGLFTQAEPYLERELEIKEKVLGMADGKIIPAMGSLILFYLADGTASKAIPLTEDVLSIAEGKLQEPSPETRGKVNFKRGKTLEAWAGTAAPVARDPLLEWAITCDALGNAYRFRGNFDMAERLYKTALDLKTTILGNQHLSLANSYDNLGIICMSKKEYDQACIFFRDALEITEAIQPPGHPDVYARLDRLAKALGQSGHYKEAEDLYARAQTLWAKEPSEGGDEARALYALGSLYIEEKKYQAAVAVLRRALHMVQAFDGPYSIGLVPYLQKYAYADYYLGRRAESDQLKARALAIAGPEVIPIRILPSACLVYQPGKQTTSALVVPHHSTASGGHKKGTHHKSHHAHSHA